MGAFIGGPDLERRACGWLVVVVVADRAVRVLGTHHFEHVVASLATPVWKPSIQSRHLSFWACGA